MLLEIGVTVLEAENAFQAIEIAKRAETHIDLLLTDVVMPGMNGWALADILSPQRLEMKVLYMSGYPDGEIVKHGAVGAGIAILRKPFTKEELARNVEDMTVGIAGRLGIFSGQSETLAK
jgi:YesN/AraC family two-component response regulator